MSGVCSVNSQKFCRSNPLSFGFSEFGSLFLFSFFSNTIDGPALKLSDAFTPDPQVSLLKKCAFSSA